MEIKKGRFVLKTLRRIRNSSIGLREPAGRASFEREASPALL